MANGFYLTNVVCQNMLYTGNTLKASLDAGTGAVIEIFSGSVPSNADATNSGTLLATLTCSKPSLASVANDGTGSAVATFASITSGTAGVTGTASFFRILTQVGGTVVAQGTVGTSSADLILNTVAITSGSTVSITAATITLPGGPGAT